MRAVQIEVARKSEASRSSRCYAFRLARVLPFVAVVAIFAGTLLQAHWTGSMESCTRATDYDSSTFQAGHASMRWIPPSIRCRFESTVGDPESARALPSVDEGHFAWFGVTIALMVTFAPSLVFACIRFDAANCSRRGVALKP